MRKLLVVIAAVLVAGLGTVAPAGQHVARAATVNPKVAIIVGATHGTTPTYRSYADQIYAAARKYTTNVVKVYSPNATWTKVKAAVSGASVIVYLGHGNGWPSPYTYDPNYTTKDGFGLNYDVNGDGKLSDNELKYYGEPSIRTLQPAPNAVVLLFHLCYASGNSESGDADPSLSVAKQRVDNYASAFLKAGASAVIANGHSHADYYIDALFTTRQSIYDYWRKAPDFHNHAATYSSTRSPGYSFAMDPESTGKYYRSITGKLDVQTQDVTGASYADTSADPTRMVVPGNASPRTSGAPVFGSVESAVAGTDPVSTLGTADKVRVDAIGSIKIAVASLDPTATQATSDRAASDKVRVFTTQKAVSAVDGSPIYQVHTDGGTKGWMRGTTLIPRDSAAPRAWTVEDGTGAFSPNGDGSQDAYTISIRLSESSTWTLRIVDGDGHKLASTAGTSDTAALTWAPAAGSVADGDYRWELGATDAWNNGPLADHGSLTVDTAAPDISVADGAASAVPQFTPNGDGVTDTIGFAVDASERGSVTATVRDAANHSVGTSSAVLGASGATITWDGKTSSGYVPDGSYSLSFTAKDPAGNRSAAQVREVTAYGGLGFVTSSKAVFFPQDGDALAPTTSLTFKLRAAATVDWTIQDAAGTVVRTLKTGAALASGSYAFTWNGKDDSGAYVARGSYRSVVHATDGTLEATQRVTTVADAFKVTSSDTTPARKQRITITATSAESLSTTPVLRIYEPGISSWTAKMTKVKTGVYRVTVTLKSSKTGTVKLKVTAYDTNHLAQGSSLSLPLH